MEESAEASQPTEQVSNSDEVVNAPENTSQAGEDNQNGGGVEEAKGNDDAEAKGGTENTENDNGQKKGEASALTVDEESDRPGTIESGSEKVQKNEDDHGEEAKDTGTEADTLAAKEPSADVHTQDANAQTDGRETPAKESETIPNKASSTNEVADSQSMVESEPVLIAPPASKTEQQSVDDAIPAKSLQDSKEAGLQTKENHQAEVKFVIMPDGHVVSMTCSLHQSVLELRAHFSTELKQPPEMILMLFDDKLVDDNSTLLDLGVQPEQAVQIEIQSANPLTAPLMYNVSPPKPKLPAQITVQVETDVGSSEVIVHIIQETRKKPFLGGFRHRLSGVEFHNASVQTLPKVRVPSPVERFNRDTQTYKMRNRLQQTTNTTSTQMTKDGCYVANLTDKIVIPGEYETAEQRHKKMLKKVLILQTYWRRWLAQQYVNGLRADRIRRQEWERQEELRKQREKAERIKREWERRMNPKTKEDFDLLYSHLDKWRKEEMARIEQLYSGPERKAALVGLLEQEAYLIASINRHKLAADKENKDKRIKGFLDKAAAPKRWKAYDGKVTEMDTPYTIRAQELRDIYNTLSMKYLTQDERLDVLLTLKHTVKEHDCKLTHEIIELIDREADLLMRGVKESNLEGLRKRILTLFLQYTKTPLFNPEAARLIKVPEDPSVLRKNIYFCPSCNSYLPSTEFKLASNSRVVGRCRRCMKLDNDARLRQDFTKYRAMLRELRRSEENFDDGSRIAFLLQEPDLRYLVENIWNSQSALSAHDDLFDLVLTRWNKHDEWSPWNCVLLTKEEAAAHSKLENVNEAYGRMFIGKILHKHVLARNYFSRLPGMADHMKTKIAELTNTGPKIGLKA